MDLGSSFVSLTGNVKSFHFQDFIFAGVVQSPHSLGVSVFGETSLGALGISKGVIFALLTALRL